MSMFLSYDMISMKNLLSVTLKFSIEGHNCKQQHDILLYSRRTNVCFDVHV
jgi:hypothetical protein